jgi:hypothetical protein
MNTDGGIGKKGTRVGGRAQINVLAVECGLKGRQMTGVRRRTVQAMKTPISRYKRRRRNIFESQHGRIAATCLISNCEQFDNESRRFYRDSRSFPANCPRFEHILAEFARLSPGIFIRAGLFCDSSSNRLCKMRHALSMSAAA